jgi:hypothetical protein
MERYLQMEEMVDMLVLFLNIMEEEEREVLYG